MSSSKTVKPNKKAAEPTVTEKRAEVHSEPTEGHGNSGSEFPKMMYRATKKDGVKAVRVPDPEKQDELDRDGWYEHPDDAEANAR